MPAGVFGQPTRWGRHPVAPCAAAVPCLSHDDLPRCARLGELSTRRWHVMDVEDDRQSLRDAVQEVADDTPIALLNLLHFRERAAVDGVEVSGKEVFERYSKSLEPAFKVVGGRPLFIADVASMLIAPKDELWDAVVIVLYPRRSAFESLLDSPEYRANAHLRTAALEDSRLLLLTAPRTISRVAWQAYRALGGLGLLRASAGRSDK